MLIDIRVFVKISLDTAFLGRACVSVIKFQLMKNFPGLKFPLCNLICNFCIGTYSAYIIFSLCNEIYTYVTHTTIFQFSSHRPSVIVQKLLRQVIQVKGKLTLCLPTFYDIELICKILRAQLLLFSELEYKLCREITKASNLY